MLDTKRYKKKPTDPWNIGKRIINNPVDIEPDQLAKELISGRTFIPSFINTCINGKLARRRECWTSQQVIALDFDGGMKIEEALNEFKNEAMFMYTTFSHTDREHRFRVVFALDQETNDYDFIQYIIKKYEDKYNIDEQCKDGVRLFYGGNTLFRIKYDNRLNYHVLMAEYAKTIDTQGLDKNRNNSNIFNNITIVPTFSEEAKTIDTIDFFDHHSNNNVKKIKERDIEYLRQRIGIHDEEKVFYTLHELKDYLFSMDLGLLLGLDSSKRFNCCFHHDRNPSAGIIYDEDQNRYIYKCFSSKCNFKTGLIIKCIETILDCDYMEALEFLMEVYNVSHKETEWQKKQKKKIDFNKQYIQSDEFQIEYPELHKRIKKYIPELDSLLDIARLNMPPEHYTNEQIENLFFVSIRHFANRIGKNSLGQVSNEIALFVYLGLLGKLRKEEIPKELLDRAEEELKKNKDRFKSDYVNMISFFHIPSYSQKNLSFSELKAIEFKEKNFTMRGWSREMLLRALGEDEANRVYPQLEGKNITNKSHKRANLIENVTMRMIENQGWVTEEYVINTVSRNYKSGKEYTKTQIKRIMSEMMDKYDLQKRRLNKDLRKQLNIKENDVKGSPSIFYKLN